MSQQLTTQHFTRVAPPSKGSPSLLKVNLKGYCVVAFIASHKICSDFIPIYNSVAHQMKNIHFFTLNIDQHRDVLTWAKSSSTDITSTPTLVLYMDSFPRSVYKQTLNPQTISNWCVTNINKLQESMNQSSITQKPAPAHSFASQYKDPNAIYRSQYYQLDATNIPTLKANIGRLGQHVTIESLQGDMELPTNIKPMNQPWLN